MTEIYLGTSTKLRNGGRYGIPSNFIKNIKLPQGDLSGWQGYLGLMMEKEDQKRWSWLVNIGRGQVSYKLGVGKNGIDYAALTYSSPGELFPITLFLYETPKNKLNIYRPGRGNTSIFDYPIPVCTDASKFTASWTYPMKDYSNIFGVPADVIFGETHQEVIKELVAAGGTGVYKDPDYSGSEITIDKRYVLRPSFDMMLDDFEHRVVQKGASKPVTPRKAKPVIGGKDKQLLIVHPDAAPWLSRLFGYKTKGIYIGMNADELYGRVGVDEDFPIYQLDTGVLYEKVDTGSTDRCVVPCRNWGETRLNSAQITKVKQLYPGIGPEDIFWSDED